MTTERIKEIQSKTAYPNSVSVQQALLQVWNECAQEQLRIADVVGQSEQLPCGDCKPIEYDFKGIRHFKCRTCGKPME